MNSPPATRPCPTSAERPASQLVPDVWLRDAGGAGGRRIPRAHADQMVRAGIAERVSAAGHVRAKLGIRVLPNGDAIHGLPAVEISRHYRGDVRTARDLRNQERRAR